MVVPAPLVFEGGQMTDLPEYTGEYDPTALFEMVAPGNVALGVNYSIATALLARFMSQGFTTPTIITTGATLGSPYIAPTTDFRVLLNKTVASDSYVDIGNGAGRKTPIMVKDAKGDADVHPITVSFTGTCDGLPSPIVISAPYGGWVFNPLADGSGNWYLTNV